MGRPLPLPLGVRMGGGRAELASWVRRRANTAGHHSPIFHLPFYFNIVQYVLGVPVPEAIAAVLSPQLRELVSSGLA